MSNEDINELNNYIKNEIKDYLLYFQDDILKIVDDALKTELNTNNMILDVDNFIFEMNKENNLLTVALKEFIEYYIKYKQ